MRLLICLLLFLPLAAQDAAGPSANPGFRSLFERDPLTRVLLAPPGCWEGLLLDAALRPPPAPQRRVGQATVEVWDLTHHETPRQQVFSLYRKDLQRSLIRALAQPPSRHAAIELGELMLSDPGHPERLDLTRVQSLQERFNRPPGSTRR